MQDSTGALTDTLVTTDAQGTARTTLSLGPSPGPLYVTAEPLSGADPIFVARTVLGAPRLEVIQDSLLLSSAGQRDGFGVRAWAGMDELYRPVLEARTSNPGVVLLFHGWTIDGPSDSTYIGSAPALRAVGPGTAKIFVTLQGTSATDSLLVRVSN